MDPPGARPSKHGGAGALVHKPGRRQLVDPHL
jgi:hypothetical protein